MLTGCQAKVLTARHIGPLLSSHPSCLKGQSIHCHTWAHLEPEASGNPRYWPLSGMLTLLLSSLPAGEQVPCRPKGKRQVPWAGTILLAESRPTTCSNLECLKKTCAGSRLGNQGRQKEMLTVAAKVLRCSFQTAGTCNLWSYLNDFLSVPLLRGF